VDQDFQLGVAGRVPLPKRFAYPRWDAGDYETTLRGNEMASKGRTVRDLRLAFGQFGDVDVVENREARHFGGWIGRDGL
jgi:hypothetical protein